jgi:hypothetical protein
MENDFEGKYQDVLQNIEAIIATTYKSDGSLTDYSVMSSVEALIDAYSAEISGRAPKSHKLSDQEQSMFQRVKEVCEWRLGRGSLDETLKKLEEDMAKKTVEEIIFCLKRILKSVKKWNREGGRRGYLDFIIDYV